MFFLRDGRGGESRMMWTKFLVVMWMVSIAAISYLSLIPKIEFPLDFENADLVYHFLAYIWLSVLPFFSFPREKTAWVSALLMFPLGIGLEIAQIFVPGRFFSPMDIGANSVGVTLGLCCAKLVLSCTNNRVISKERGD
jgi:VanZ family protein